MTRRLVAVVFVAAAFGVVGAAPTDAGPSPAITVTPDTGLVHDQTVAVAGTGFPTDVPVYIGQCRTAPTSLADCGPYQPVDVDGSGSFSSPLTVKVFLDLFGEQVDCRESGACVVGAGPTLEDAVFAPIEFDPNGPVPPVPTLAVTPKADLADGQTVTVTGANFGAGTQVGYGQCISGATSSSDCDINAIEFVTGDPAGAWTGPLTVHAVIDTPTAGTVDCRVTACVIAAAPINLSELVEVPITFRPAPAAVVVQPAFTG